MEDREVPAPSLSTLGLAAPFSSKSLLFDSAVLILFLGNFLSNLLDCFETQLSPRPLGSREPLLNSCGHPGFVPKVSYRDLFFLGTAFTPNVSSYSQLCLKLTFPMLPHSLKCQGSTRHSIGNKLVLSESLFGNR